MSDNKNIKINSYPQINAVGCKTTKGPGGGENHEFYIDPSPSGAVKGTAVGAVIGSVVPVVGTAVEAGVRAILGTIFGK